MVKEQTIWHKISGIKDDGRQHVEEEDVRSQRGRRMIGGEEEEETDEDTHDDQKARFGENVC